jgi:hypothetical protein
MSNSAPPSKLPAWIFYVSDLALLAVAVFIAAEAPRPLPNPAIFAIVACVIAGAILATVPRLVEYEREKNATLDERQSALEGLAQTLANSAEQISVAATGLHAIADLAHKNLRQAEQLPHKLQDKIAEFQAQLANADDAEKEELEKELVALRSSESERLEGISDRIAKSVAEFARLQTQLQKQLAAAPARLTPNLAPPPPVAAKPREVLTDRPTVEPSPAESSPVPVATDASAAVPATPPKPARPRREEPLAAVVGVTAVAPMQAAIPREEPAPAKPVEIAPVVPQTRPPYPDDLVVQEKNSGGSSPTTASTPPLITAVTAAKPVRKRAERKASETPADELLGLEIPVAPAPPASEPPGAPTLVAKAVELSPSAEASLTPSPTTDGATRLLITAYIGIGNRLFIRGEGPGLGWEKGIPLQFVSIGKWRWEAAGAASPVKFKLYKNDETECASLGLQTLAAGHQQELTATF